MTNSIVLKQSSLCQLYTISSYLYNPLLFQIAHFPSNIFPPPKDMYSHIAILNKDKAQIKKKKKRNRHQHNTDDGGQAMGEEMRHIQMSR